MEDPARVPPHAVPPPGPVRPVGLGRVVAADPLALLAQVGDAPRHQERAVHLEVKSLAVTMYQGDHGGRGPGLGLHGLWSFPAGGLVGQLL